jgi:Ca2+-binding EF-hand superfamily protein
MTAKFSLTAGSLVAALLFACASADPKSETAESAQPLPAAPAAPRAPERAGRGDGHHRRFSAEGLLERFDANKNGSLELTELPEHKREKLGRADANRDGSIARDELAAHWAHKHAGHRRDGRWDPARMLERLDADKNGSLEREELPEHKRDKFGALDQNADGRVTKEELEQHFEARRAERR